jgi:hypothetical protein
MDRARNIVSRNANDTEFCAKIEASFILRMTVLRFSFATLAPWRLGEKPGFFNVTQFYRQFPAKAQRRKERISASY